MLASSFLTKNKFAYERLKTSILTADFKPGRHLVISKLAKEMGISAIPIREAITRLTAEGLVTQTPHIGAMVAPFNFMELKENYLIRAELEGLATQYATEHLTKQDFENLEKNIERMRRLIAKKEFKKIRAVNQEFHKIIYNACPYKKLLKIISELWDHIDRLRSLFALVPARAKASLEEHIKIVDALKRRDAHLAQTLIEENTLLALKSLEDYSNSEAFNKVAGLYIGTNE